ncbi:MAG TPA: ABC-F family ATP-binding cassette domain-containing protein [Candidatus Krumholzibacteria bacterium]
MALLTLVGVGFDYGRQTVLEAANLTIHAGERYGLVGLNGAGKSTLLRLLAGEMQPLRGKVERSGRISIGSLPQDTELNSPEPLREAVRRAAFGELLDAEQRLVELSERMGEGDSDPSLMEEYGRLHELFESADGYSIESRTEAALFGLGFERDRLGQPVQSLSGGQKRRAALAALLLAPHDLLLLDEPTNHLDLEAREWLEAHLAERKTAIVTISHDRAFLDQATAFTLHLLQGRLTRYTGGYSKFLTQWREQKAQWEGQYRRQQDHIQKTEAFIRKNIAGVRTSQAKSRRKQLARLDRVDAPPNEGRSLRMDLAPSRASGGVIFEAHGLGVRFDGLELFGDLEFQVLRGDKVGIVGPNGCGKSSLLKLLLRQLQCSAGRVVRGTNVDLGYFDQELGALNDSNTVFDEIRQLQPDLSDGDVYSVLGAFQFPKDMTDQQIRTLSGGERARLSLLKLILERHNTLLLDEPTNHLDVETRESLEDALVAYGGTVIVVSHDRYFLNRICDRIFAFESLGKNRERFEVYQSLGDYTDYRRSVKRRREQEREVASAPTPTPATPRPPADTPRRKRDLSKNELAKLRREVMDLEEEISFLEIESEELGETMSSGAGPGELAGLGRRAQKIRERLDAKMRRWEQLNELLER